MHSHHHETALGPSGPGTVVLNIGGGTGALVLNVPPELDGREIEISRVGFSRTWECVRGKPSRLISISRRSRAAGVFRTSAPVPPPTFSTTLPGPDGPSSAS